MQANSVISFGMTKSLGRARVDRTGDPRSWTPIEMLEDLIREAREGRVDLSQAVVVFSGSESGDATIRRAGCDIKEEFVLLRTAMADCAGL